MNQDCILISTNVNLDIDSSLNKYRENFSIFNRLDNSDLKKSKDQSHIHTEASDEKCEILHHDDVKLSSEISSTSLPLEQYTEQKKALQECSANLLCSSNDNEPSNGLGFRVEDQVVSSSEIPLKNKQTNLINCGKYILHEEVSANNLILHPKTYECKVCGKIFPNKRYFDQHYRTHTNEKPYQCNICGRKFPFQRSRDRHYRTHTNVKAYECKICFKKFSRNQGLKSHSLTHTKEKPHECEICHKKFPRVASLRQHYRLHTNEKPYDCEVCGMSFALKRNRDRHHRVVHMNYKPYECLECGKKFIFDKLLRSHLSTHTKEKLFFCNICNKGYSYEASLIKHNKLHLS